MGYSGETWLLLQVDLRVEKWDRIGCWKDITGGDSYRLI